MSNHQITLKLDEIKRKSNYLNNTLKVFNTKSKNTSVLQKTRYGWEALWGYQTPYPGGKQYNSIEEMFEDLVRDTKLTSKHVEELKSLKSQISEEEYFDAIKNKLQEYNNYKAKIWINTTPIEEQTYDNMPEEIELQYQCVYKTLVVNSEEK